jgi:hypothetical protein
MDQGQRKKNSGFINVSLYEEPNGGYTASIGGSFTDKEGKVVDLGFARTRIESIEENISLIAKQLKLAVLNGKTMKPREQKNGNSNRS